MSSDIEIISPSELADTADTALNKALEAPDLDPIVLSVANKYIECVSLQDIAEEYDVPTDVITKTLEKKEVQNYITAVFMNQGYINRFRRMKIINDVIDQKLQDAIETGVYSKEDLLKWMKHLNDIETTVTSKEKQGPVVAIQVNSNYDTLIQDLMKDGKKS